MISCWIQEQHRYTGQELFKQLRLSEEKGMQLLGKLKAIGFVKTVQETDAERLMTELTVEEEYTPEPGNNAVYYVFTFVGVITVSGRILKCCPKYMDRRAHKKELRQILKVIQKYNTHSQEVKRFFEKEEPGTFNRLSVMLWLLNDYHENGIYSNTEEIVENNGSGEILWDRTIHNTFALLQDDGPYYAELQTRRRIQDERDYFRRLHSCALTMISQELDQTDLSELFDIATVSLSEEILEDFGEKEEILDHIEKESRTQFNTRKQNVLKSLYSWISGEGQLADENCFAFFGTNSFNLVWETACQEVFQNQLKTPLGALPVQTARGYDKRELLIDLIEKPVWSGNGFSLKAPDTLIPDLITIEKTEKGNRFIILDAKYYVPQMETGKPLRGQPGIESVTKQYLYQLAYRRYLQDHGITDVANCFILPKTGKQTEERGTVSLPMLEALGLQPIRVIFLSAEWLFSKYLGGWKILPKDTGI